VPFLGELRHAEDGAFGVVDPVGGKQAGKGRYKDTAAVIGDGGG